MRAHSQSCAPALDETRLRALERLVACLHQQVRRNANHSAHPSIHRVLLNDINKHNNKLERK